MKYFIISGEASGDLHGANLIKALRGNNSKSSFVGLGGDKMRAEGCEIIVDYREMAYMGIIAVLQNLDKVHRNLQLAKQSLLNHQPDVLVLIDYPSFNLRIAKFCKQHLPATRIVYYIPPKVWAWKKWRVHQIARYTDAVLGIFPFEPSFYQNYGYTCQYVGNPTADCIRDWKSNYTLSTIQHDKDSIAILPGSRRSEISHCLPVMLKAARRVAQDRYQIFVAAAPGIEDAFYAPFLQGEKLVRDTYALLASARVAVVNSGTATLETALIGCPQTAVYYIACSKWLEWLIRPLLFTIPHFTLVNIIPHQEIIQELIASRFTEENVANELYRLLNDKSYRQTMLTNYDLLWRILGTHDAAQEAAKIISTVDS